MESYTAFVLQVAQLHVIGHELIAVTSFLSLNSFLWILSRQGTVRSHLWLINFVFVGQLISLLYQIGVGVIFLMFSLRVKDVNVHTALYVGGATLFSMARLCQLWLNCFSHEEKEKMKGVQTSSEKNLSSVCFDQASIFQRLTFSWINPLFRKAEDRAFLLPPNNEKLVSSDVVQKKKTTFYDIIEKLPPLPEKFKSEEEMLKPLIAARAVEGSTPRRQTFKGLWHLCQILYKLDGGKEYLWICIPLKISQDILSVLCYNSISSVMMFYENSSQFSTVSEALLSGLALCGFNIGIRLLQSILFQLYLYHLYSSSLKVTIALKTLILNSVLETPLGSAHTTTSTTSQEKKGKKEPFVKGSTEKEDLGSGGVSEALSLLTVDADRFGESMIFLHNAWSHPIVIFLALANMYRITGLIPTLVAFTSLLLAIPLNKKSSQIVKYAKKSARDVVLRLSDLMVALPMMRSVHAMSLQNAFLSRMQRWRTEESRGARGIIHAEAEATLLTEVILIGIYILAYASYFLFGNDPVMAVSSLLPVAASLCIVRFPIWASPNLVTQVVNGYDALTRIEAFVSRCPSPRHKNADDTCQSATTEANKRGSIQCRGVDFYWSRHSLKSVVSNPTAGLVSSTQPFPSVTVSSPTSIAPVLSNLHLHILPGEYIVIGGKTGVGKTALFLALLGELCAVPSNRKEEESESGTYQNSADAFSPFDCHQRWCNGSVVYCAETPWIADGTVRGNILMRSVHPLSRNDGIPMKEETKKIQCGTRNEEFASPEEEAWYRTVFHACELDVDAKAMEHSDLSEVGTAGSRLSGGQRARVAIARALCYRMGNSDIFIFDNVLSALDYDLQQRVVQNVFHALIRKRGKTLMVSSSVYPPNLLVKAKVFVVHPGGKVEVSTSPLSSPSESLSPLLSSSALHQSTVHASPETNTIPLVKVEPRPCNEEKKKMVPISRPHAVAPAFSLLPHWTELKTLFWDHFGHRTAILVLALFVVRQVLFSLADNWMGVWFFLQGRASCESKETLDHGFATLFQDLGGCKAVTAFIVTYAIVGAIACLVSYCRSTYFFVSFRSAADRLHMTVVGRILDAPASFFDDSTAVDRIVQVLTKDQNVIDQMVAESVKLIITSILHLATMIAVNMIQYPLYIIVVPVMVSVFYYLCIHFLSLSKQLRVLESHGKEKATMTLKNAVAGAITLRAFGDDAKLATAQEWCRAIDATTQVSHVAITNDRWVALRLELLSLFMLALLQLFILAAVLFETIQRSVGGIEKSRYKGSSALAGLGALAIMSSTQQLGQLCRRLGMFQSQFVSVQRFTEIERDILAIGQNTEDPSVITAVQSSSNSATDCENVVLSISNLSCSYQRHLPRVLSSFSIDVRSGECVGIIGRSGSGKSSLFNALLHVMDVVDGAVYLRQRTGKRERVDARTIPLYDLRRKFLHLIPQEPLIVEGTIRENLLLGVVESFSDEELMNCLSQVGILAKLEAAKRKEEESALDIHVNAGGKNLSAGQGQLLSIARALLHKPSVLLLDEVTSRIDKESEMLLVKVIQDKLRSGCSVILISHRRETVEALCHRALVIRSGTVVSEVSESQMGKAFDTFHSSAEIVE